MQEKYEISLWEDVWHPPILGYSEGGRTVPEVPGWFEERKLCVIGSDKITATCRALEPKLVRNIDGTNTLTFKMLYVCRDDTYEELLRQFIVEPNNEQSLDLNNLYGRVDLIPLLARADHFGHETYKNPFIKLLTNERKVKAFWQGKWYDLLIKNCQESSDQRMVTYTCTDIFINELSKSGTDIILDTELKNNNGSVEELAEVVLDGTDWFVDSEKCDLIQQFKEEAVYEVETETDITANNDSAPPSTATIPRGSNILVSYSQIQDAVYKFCERVEIDPYLQFAYTTDPSYECADGGMLVTNADIYSCDNVTYKFYRSNSNNPIPKGDMSILDEISIVKAYIANAEDPFISIALINDGYIAISDNYRINRLVRAQKTVYDPVIKKYCTVYEGIGNFSTFINVGDEIHKYVESQYNNPVNVNNLVVNGKGFTSLDGWSGNNLSFKLYPAYNNQTPYNPKSYLKLTDNQYVYNAGLRYNSNYISNGFAEGENYIFRYKARRSSDLAGSDVGNDYCNATHNFITPIIGNYTYNDNQIVYDPNGTNYFNIVGEAHYSDDDENDVNYRWVWFKMQCARSVTRADIYNDKIGLFLQTDNVIADGVAVWLEEAQFFPYVEKDSVDKFLCPGEMSTDLVVTTTYNYYNYTKNKNALNEEDIVYLWRGTTENPTLATYIAPVYNENFEKILTVSAKQSNRYNLLRTLAEKFECYVYFNIEHNPLTGALIYENNIPKKSVYFKNTQGQRTGIGFIYGIDLKAVQRTIQSDQIVTKTVVSMNNNQYAKDGFCTIARSKENYTKESFILNFDYYVSQNLLNKEDLDRELKRYYSMLNFYNSNYNDEVNHINQLSAILLKQRSYLILYESTINNLILQKENLWNELTSLTGGAVVDDATYHTYIQNHPDATEIISRYQAIKSLEDSLSSYEDSYSNLESSVSGVSGLESQIENLKAGAQATLTNLVNEHAVFYRKYSRFIQEGTWKDDSYMDDDLYYLDALKVARESAHPKVSYNISVIRVSSLEEFKAKQFQLGDITYIQDTEFFGYTTINGIKTPYKESVLISEITSNFEEPEKDSFKVQNYKTEFEDLFQRINRTSQTYGYAADRYEKIDAISTTDGLLDAEVLQDSINAAKVPISISGNRITQDENGIIISDLTQANRQTRITAGGISVTTDGGDTWKNTMIADGVPIEGLAPGVIDVGKVGLVDRSNNLQWTSQGIKDQNNFISWTSQGIKDQNNFISWDSQGISIYGATPSSTLDSTKYIRFSKGGMEMRGPTGSEGVVYADGVVRGDFNNVWIATVPDSSNPSKTDRLTIDNDTISHYNCDGNLCDPGGEIRFNTPDGIVMRPRNGSEINITLSTTQIDLNANIVNINGTYESNPASLTFDIGQAKMIYTYISGGETIKKQLDFLTLRGV